MTVLRRQNVVLDPNATERHKRMNAVSIDIGGIFNGVNEHRDEINPGFDGENLIGLDLSVQTQVGEAVRRAPIFGLRRR